MIKIPSSQPALLSATNLDELQDELNKIFKDIYSFIDIAMRYDGKGVIESLKYGGLGRDVSASSAIIGIADGESVDVVPLSAAGALTDVTTLNASATAHGLLPKLSDVVTEFLTGKGTWVNPVIQGWPIGSIFISVVATNPGTLLGFGTWSAFGTGRMLIAIDPGDTDFDTVLETGGAKTHTHSVDVAATTSGAPSATTTVDNDGALSTVAVGSGTHTHSTDPAAVTSGSGSNMPPFIAVYIWRRDS